MPVNIETVFSPLKSKLAQAIRSPDIVRATTITQCFKKSNVKKGKKVALPNLRPSTKTISLKFPQHLPGSIKVAANVRDAPYQSLIKVWLQEKLHSNSANQNTVLAIKRQYHQLSALSCSRNLSTLLCTFPVVVIGN